MVNMTWDDVVAYGLHLPEVVRSTSYGTPALKVNHKLIARLRTEDDGVVLLGVPFEEREMLLQLDGQRFYLTPHYEDHEIVLGRLIALQPDQLHPMLFRRWKSVAPKRAIIQYEALTQTKP
jgi:hypothetical protein